MKPVKFDGAEIVYRGPTEEIGDLWCERLRPGLIKSVWEFTDAEREIIANGGRVELLLFNEPIPPITLAVLTDEQSTPVGEHGWKGQGPSSEPPHDYWRPLPCGHPPDPVAWVGPNGPVCHCAAILDPADGIELPTRHMFDPGSDGGRLRHARQTAGFTQEALAARAQVAAATVRRAELGATAPRRLTRHALADALRVPAAQIWPYDDEAEVEGAPGPVVQCTRCGCAVAVPDA